jgi:pimeloyl-ACP methyl ester carboxylesterase
MAAGNANTCEDGPQASGAVYRICMPEPEEWNGALVIYAHGYVAFNEPVGIPENHLVLPDGTSIPDIMNGLGFAFATSSYSTNGLAMREGVEDVRDLVDIFRARHGEPRRVYLGGASEGGLVTALALERFPEAFDGGLAACGPVGSFRQQVNYMGDFRVVFDYFFPDVLPGTFIDIPQEVIDNWEAVYEPAVASALAAEPRAADQLLRVTRVPTDRRDPDSAIDTMVNVLWYNVFGANDAATKLGGQPFDNSRRIYLGSRNDFRLNRRIERYEADAAAVEEINTHYETSGQLASPLVSLHTTGDPVVPYWHAMLYRAKALSGPSPLLYSNIPIVRYGHCNFKISEVLAAFALLVLKVTGQELLGAEHALPDDVARAEFVRLAREVGALR